MKISPQNDGFMVTYYIIKNISNNKIGEKMKPKHIGECWVCNGEYQYYYDKEYENQGFYAFMCKCCGEKIVTPKNNPTLEFIDDC